MIHIEETKSVPVISLQGSINCYPNEKGESVANITLTKRDINGDVVESVSLFVKSEDFNDFWEDHYNSEREVVDYFVEKTGTTMTIPEDVTNLFIN